MTKTQENILKFLDFWGGTAEEFLLKSRFTKRDLTSLKRTNHIRRDFRPPMLHSGEWVFSLKQKGIDYLSTLPKE